MKEESDNLQHYERSSKLSKKDIIVNNFLGGIFWALGATIGLSLIIWLLTLLSQNINFIPIIGNFVSDIINFILSTNPNLHK